MAGDPRAWLVDLAMQLQLIKPGTILPTGVILRHTQDRQRGDRESDARRFPFDGLRAGDVSLASGGRGACKALAQADRTAAAGVVQAVLMLSVRCRRG
jgi:hypothetical protein